MSEATLWWLLTGALVAAELLSGTLYLLLLALGAAAGALAAHIGFPVMLQLTLAATIGAGSTAACALWRRRQRRRHPTCAAPVCATDMSLDIGQQVKVTHWNADGTTRVHHRGADWTAVPTPGAERRSGTWRITAVDGNRLVIEPASVG